MKKKFKKEYIYNQSFKPLKQILDDDSCGIFPAATSAQDALSILCDYLLGDDWYVVDPIGVNQCNTLIVKQILDKYSKEWKKDCNYYKKHP